MDLPCGTDPPGHGDGDGAHVSPGVQGTIARFKEISQAQLHGDLARNARTIELGRVQLQHPLRRGLQLGVRRRAGLGTPPRRLEGDNALEPLEVRLGRFEAGGQAQRLLEGLPGGFVVAELE